MIPSSTSFLLFSVRPSPRQPVLSLCFAADFSVEHAGPCRRGRHSQRLLDGGDSLLHKLVFSFCTMAFIEDRRRTTSPPLPLIACESAERHRPPLFFGPPFSARSFTYREWKVLLFVYLRTISTPVSSLAIVGAHPASANRNRLSSG